MILGTESIKLLIAKNAPSSPISVFIEPDGRLNVHYAKQSVAIERAAAEPDSLIGQYHNGLINAFEADLAAVQAMAKCSKTQEI